MLKWYVAWTRPHKEFLARDELTKQAFETYLPLHMELFGKIVPLFSRYIMVRFDVTRDPWGRIANTRGIDGLVCHGPAQPTPLPESAILELLARTSDRGIVDDPGDAPQSPLGGVPTEWLRLGDLDAGSRVKLLYRLFGASVARREMENAA